MTKQSASDSAGEDVVGAAGAALIGLLLGGPVGAVAGNALARPVTELVHKSWAELVAFRQGNIESLVTQAAERAAIDPEEIIAKAQQDSRVNRLFQASLVAAAEALDREKIEALAKCLANGIQDVARTEEEGLIVRALMDLDPVHVRLLASMNDHRMDRHDIDIFTRGAARGGESEWGLHGPYLVEPVVTVLERNGLVFEGPWDTDETAPARQVRTWYCTDFARECLQRLGHETGPTQRELAASLRNRQWTEDEVQRLAYVEGASPPQPDSD